ncbi:MAG: hypothetical protein WA082_01765 [Candidatus Moraniibacteriota bacterium]
MSLKILVVPFSILLALIIVIGFIKPDIGVVQEKKNLLMVKETQSKDMGTLLDNISALTASLDEQSTSESLLGSYIPQTLDQERVIDMFNYLAAQAGVSVSVMAMQDVMFKVEEEPIIDPATIVDGSVAPVPPAKPQVKAFSASVKVTGDYARIKDFFHRLAHMNRFHKIQSFSLGVTPVDQGDGDASSLTGLFVSQFDYFPASKVDTAVNAPVFLKGTFDMTELDTLLAWISYPVSPLGEPATGRPNPFQ